MNAAHSDTLYAALEQALVASAPGGLVVALSGGVDSTVLLALAQRYATTHGVALVARHVDHGLHTDSAAWAGECVQIARSLGVRCEVLRVDGAPAAGSSIEAWARTHRYQELARNLRPGDCVLTGHHADDQAETVLQRVLEGAGPFGLRGMPAAREFAAGRLLRPFLSFSRDEIAAAHSELGLAVVHDPANDDPRYLRTRLRDHLLPAATATVPGARRGLLRLAEVQADVSTLIDGLTDHAIDADPHGPHGLAVATVVDCAPALRPFLLRRAALRAGLAAPGERHLRELLSQLLTARADRCPEVRWGTSIVRRHRDRLHFLREGELGKAPDKPIAFTRNDCVALPWGTLSLRDAAPGTAAIDGALLNNKTLSVRFRRGGETLRPLRRGRTRRLKQLFQEWGVPPWERGVTPLLFADERLVAVGDYCIEAAFLSADAAGGLAVSWDRGD